MTERRDIGPCSAGSILFAREPDGIWPTPDNPCAEPAVKIFQMITPGIGLYVAIAPLCAMHDAVLISHFNVVKEPFAPEGLTYYVRAKRVGDLWELTISDVGIVMGGGYIGDAWKIAAAYIHIQTGETVAEDNIRLAVEGDPEDYLKPPEKP